MRNSCLLDVDVRSGSRHGLASREILCGFWGVDSSRCTLCPQELLLHEEVSDPLNPKNIKARRDGFIVARLGRLTHLILDHIRPALEARMEVG